MINIEGKFYKIDMDAAMSWISEAPSSEKNITTLTTITYDVANDEDDEIVQKEVSETKTSLNDTMTSIRRDFVLYMLNTLMGQINEISQINSISDLNFAQKLAFNTLLAKNIIIEETEYNE